jgi:hypothetical protein
MGQLNSQQIFDPGEETRNADAYLTAVTHWQHMVEATGAFSVAYMEDIVPFAEALALDRQVDLDTAERLSEQAQIDTIPKRNCFSVFNRLAG